MISIILVIVGLSFLIFIHEAGHFLMAKLFKLKVDEFGFGLPPRLWGKQIGETIYSINWLPFGGFVKVYGEDGGENLTMSSLTSSQDINVGPERSFAAQPVWKRAIIIIAGVTMNFIVGWLMVSAVLMIGAPAGVTVTEVSKDSPAFAVGVRPGDRFSDFEKVEQFIQFVNGQKGKETVFKIQRGKETLEVKAIPRVSPPEGEGAFGVALVEGGGRLGFFQSFWEGLKTTLFIIRAVFSGIFQLIKGVFTGTADFTGVVGPVGILGVATEAGRLGLVYLLQLIALISINLGAINIFPFPALDGGRLLFIAFEKIKGSPLPLKAERLANGVGFAFLLLLMIVITARDIGNLL